MGKILLACQGLNLTAEQTILLQHLESELLSIKSVELIHCSTPAETTALQAYNAKIVYACFECYIVNVDTELTYTIYNSLGSDQNVFIPPIYFDGAASKSSTFRISNFYCYGFDNHSPNLFTGLKITLN